MVVLQPGNCFAPFEPERACEVGINDRGAVGFDDSSLVTRPVLRPGDLLLHAATLAHKLRIPPGSGTQLLTADFVSTLVGNWAGDRATVPGGAQAPPEWLARLSPTQQAAMGAPPPPSQTTHFSTLPSGLAWA
jgi:hypothetical protein